MTATLSMSAQDKLFTLEDLNFGGNNYRNMQPENMWHAWWGDKLVQTDTEYCSLVDVKTGKKKQLFTVQEINQWAKSEEDANRHVYHLSSATFPYPDQPLVAVAGRKSFLLLNFLKSKPETGIKYPRLLHM